MSFMKSHRRLVLGGGTGIGVLVFLAICVLVQYLAIQNPKRWDMTASGRHTIAPQSRKVLDTFRQKNLPVDIIAFYGNRGTGDSVGRDEVADLLDQYRDEYKALTYTVIDPDKELAVAKRNKIESYPTLILKAGDREERIQTVNEETVTNALMKLLRTEAKKIYFLKGHGELSPTDTEPTGFSVAKEQIEKQNYKTEELILLQTPAVPDDCTVLIIAGPRNDPMDNEMEAIRAYLKRGGSVLMLLQPFRTPVLGALLKEYGIETAEDIVIDQVGRVAGGDYLIPVITAYDKEFPITKNFTTMSFFPEARSMMAAKTPPPNGEAIELAMTSPKPMSWTINAEQLQSGNATYDEKTGIMGPISLMTVSTVTQTESPADKKPEAVEGKEEPKTEPPAVKEPAKPKKARVVAFGSSLFAANKFHKLQGNPDLFLNAVSWLAEEENLISIRPKTVNAQPLVLTANQALVAVLVPVVLIPLVWIIAGVFVFLYRRRTSVA